MSQGGSGTVTTITGQVEIKSVTQKQLLISILEQMTLSNKLLLLLLKETSYLYKNETLQDINDLET